MRTVGLLAVPVSSQKVDYLDVLTNSIAVLPPTCIKIGLLTPSDGSTEVVPNTVSKVSWNIKSRGRVSNVS